MEEIIYLPIFAVWPNGTCFEVFPGMKHSPLAFLVAASCRLEAMNTAVELGVIF